MADPLSLVIAGLALGVSSVTAWLTLFRRGTITMTQPTVFFFGPDGRSQSEPAPKIYLRTLLYSTSRRGRVVENMYVSLSHGEARQNFNIWVYGEERLTRGSGLFVGPEGVAANHHFLLPKDASRFQFREGQYKLNVYVHLLGDRADKLLFSQILEVSREQAEALIEPDNGLYFDWGPDSSRYISHIEHRTGLPMHRELAAMLGLDRPEGPD